MTAPTLFVATPLHAAWLHQLYMAGALQAMTAFAGRIRFDTFVGSFLPISRDVLTKKFLESGATHMLCIDSDIGWTPGDAQKLLDSGKEFVSGCYVKKQAKVTLPAKLTAKHEGELWEAEHVPAGFLLLSRRVVEQMVEAYRAELQYESAFGQTWALWSSLFTKGQSYDGEDVSFCRRWRQIGGQVWLHQGVVLAHAGEKIYLPTEG